MSKCGPGRLSGWRWVVAFLCLGALAVVGSGAAHAIELVSYVDEEGRLIVVDGLESVPPDRRHTARFGSVSRHQPPPPPPVSSGQLSGEPEPPMSATAPAGAGGRWGAGDLPREPLDAAAVVASDPARASATLWLGELAKVQDRAEQIWGIARTIDPRHRHILLLQTESINALERLSPFRTMLWNGQQSWVGRAAILTEQFRTLQFSITRWIQEGGGRLFQELPPLLGRTRFSLDQLRQSFPAPVASGSSTP